MKTNWKEKYPAKCFLARKSLPILIGLSIFFLILGLVLFVVFLFNEHYLNFSLNIDTQLAAEFGSFFQGLIGTIFGIAGALLIALTFLYQSLTNKKTQTERIFLTMLSYHRANVRNIRIKSYKEFAKKNADKVEGARAFVLFKLQLFEILRIVQDLNATLKLKLSTEKEINLAYMVFFYGIDKEWDSFTNVHLRGYGKDLLDRIEKERVKILKETGKNIGRTNQTILSSYYRNMYNAIKFIDESIYLTQNEKYDYIKIYRAQLSNSELAVFVFNIQSNFGKKWKSYSKKGKDIPHNLIEKYKLIKNIPAGYLQNYDHKKSFDMEYEDDELAT